MVLRTAWEVMVCDCGICEGCKEVEKQKNALRQSAREIAKIVEKRFAEYLYKEFSSENNKH